LSRQEVVQRERTLEMEVSQYIGTLPFLWVGVNDAPGPDSDRGRIERNSIALLSNYQRAVLDAPSKAWLGRCSDRERVRSSGLWNNNHVGETYDAAFLSLLERYIRTPDRGGAGGSD
jgi:hypothetical protein